MQGNPSYIPIFDTYLQFVGALISSPSNVPFVRAYDTFTDTDGTALNSHTMNIGPGWVLSAATYTIQSNKASSSTSSSFATVSVGVTDCTITGSASAINPGGSGFVFRYQDANNYWAVRIRPPTDFQIIEVVSGVVGIKQFTTGTFNDGVLYDFTITISGTNVTASIAGQGTLTEPAMASYLTATKFGLYTTGNSVAATYDNFLLIG